MEIFEIQYMYRDASNYKYHGSALVKGHLELKDLQPFLFEGDYFIPRAVGLKCLVPADRDSDDHELHELCQITPTSCEGESIDSGELLQAFRDSATRGWFHEPTMVPR